ncbi:MAG: flagellar hook-associated protein FlgK [Clostridia bacterium]|nr:flagellar hook-associated protein FlgK [Clostridia bacterium]
MPLMGSLYTGVSGLQTSQNALNTTAHNLSNLETIGYVRQQVLLGTREYNTISNSAISKNQVGLGVNYEKVRQVRDQFLDLSYREETGRTAFYEISFDVANEIETLLGEMEGVAFQNSLNDLWVSVQELAKDPASAVNQGLLVSKATVFLERANAVSGGLSSYQQNLNLQVKDAVDQVNKYAETIYELNNKIRKVEVGSEEANDLRDARNQAIDELAALVPISYDENADGLITVDIDGQVLVSKDRTFPMGVKRDETTGFYTPVWTFNNDAPVFDLSRKISSDLDTDIGKLKALVLARGDHSANYSDLKEPGYTDKGIRDSFVMKVQAEFDNLIHGVTTAMNCVLCGESNPPAAGTSYAQGECPIELFVRLGTPRYVDDGTGNYVYVEEHTAGSPSDISTMYTTANLKINPDLLKQPTLLSFVKADQKVDQDKADKLKAIFTDKFDTLNPDVTKTSNFQDYYSDLVGAVANEGSVYKNRASSQSSTVKSIEDARQQVAGVSQDEELTNMIKFQNAYNASSRYINAIDEMLEHIINKLG